MLPSATCWTQLRSYAFDLVVEGKTCYAQLNKDEKEILTGLFIRNCSNSEAYEFITESDAKSQLPFMLADFMTHQTNEKLEEFIQYIMDKSCEWAAKRIDDLLSQVDWQFKDDKKKYIGEDEE